MGCALASCGRDEVWPTLPAPLPLLSCRAPGRVSKVVNQLSLSNAAGSGASAGFGAGGTPARPCGGLASPRRVPRAKRQPQTGAQRQLRAQGDAPHLQHRLCGPEEVISPFPPAPMFYNPAFICFSSLLSLNMQVQTSHWGRYRPQPREPDAPRQP